MVSKTPKEPEDNKDNQRNQPQLPQEDEAPLTSSQPLETPRGQLSSRFIPLTPSNVLYNYCTNLRPPPLRRWRREAWINLMAQQQQQQPPPTSNSKEPSENSMEVPTENESQNSPDRPSEHLVAQGSSNPVPPPSPITGLAPLPVVVQPVASQQSTRPVPMTESSVVAASLQNEGKAETKPQDSKTEMDDEEDNSDPAGQNSPTTIQIYSKEKSDAKTRRYLKARHGGGGVRTQKNCSQPTIYSYRPTRVTCDVPPSAIRPSFIPTSPKIGSALAEAASTAISQTLMEIKQVNETGNLNAKCDQCNPAAGSSRNLQNVGTTEAAKLMPPPSKIPTPMKKQDKEPRPPLSPGLLFVQQQVAQVCGLYNNSSAPPPPIQPGTSTQQPILIRILQSGHFQPPREACRFQPVRQRAVTPPATVTSAAGSDATASATPEDEQVPPEELPKPEEKEEPE